LHPYQNFIRVMCPIFRPSALLLSTKWTIRDILEPKLPHYFDFMLLLFDYVLYCWWPQFKRFGLVWLDKYSSQFGGVANPYSYYHDEDESSFQLVDTSRLQKPIYQRGRVRFNQVFLYIFCCIQYWRQSHLYIVSRKKSLQFFSAVCVNVAGVHVLNEIFDSKVG